jgi:hypothetical protein
MTADGCAVPTTHREDSSVVAKRLSAAIVYVLFVVVVVVVAPSERTQPLRQRYFNILHRTTRYCGIVGDIIITIIHTMYFFYSYFTYVYAHEQNCVIVDGRPCDLCASN